MDITVNFTSGRDTLNKTYFASTTTCRNVPQAFTSLQSQQVHHWDTVAPPNGVQNRQSWQGQPAVFITIV